MLEKMIDRRASKGANRAESAALLDDLLETVAHGDNLVHALVYQDFATPRQATKFVDALAAA